MKQLGNVLAIYWSKRLNGMIGPVPWPRVIPVCKILISHIDSTPLLFHFITLFYKFVKMFVITYIKDKIRYILLKSHLVSLHTMTSIQNRRLI